MTFSLHQIGVVMHVKSDNTLKGTANKLDTTLSSQIMENIMVA